MDDVGKEGRTVIFVSHNLNAVRRLCSKGLILECGRLTQNLDDVLEATNIYINQTSSSTSSILLEARQDRKGNGILTFTSFNFSVDNENESYILILLYIFKIQNHAKNNKNNHNFKNL